MVIVFLLDTIRIIKNKNNKLKMIKYLIKNFRIILNKKFNNK